MSIAQGIDKSTQMNSETCMMCAECWAIVAAAACADVLLTQSLEWK